ncbi:MAG: hypothetical protein P8188_03820 [Gemmatimonadota bacterium]|jgi:hypothetical protein
MDTGILKRGVASGFVGALVLVLWFFLVDTVRGEPLATPRFVAGALLGGPALAAVPAYTVLHFMSFQVVGFATAWAMNALKIVAPTLLGLAVGAVLFDLIFYGSVMATGADIVAELGWRTVLAGNLLAGLAVTYTVHWMDRPEGESWLTELLQGPVLREGMIVGLAGAAVVALWFLALDTLAGEPLRTPSAMGGLVFGGETDAANLPVRMSWVVGYTAVHIGIGLVLGSVLAAASAAVEGSPPLVVATVLAFVSFEALIMGIVGLVSFFLPHHWTVVAIGNFLAAATMVWILWRRHPQLARDLRSEEALGSTS